MLDAHVRAQGDDDRAGRATGGLLVPDWIDHAYRLRLADRRWRYVAEPYVLKGDALSDLAHLALTASMSPCPHGGFAITLAIPWRLKSLPEGEVRIDQRDGRRGTLRFVPGHECSPLHLDAAAE